MPDGTLGRGVGGGAGVGGVGVGGVGVGGGASGGSVGIGLVGSVGNPSGGGVGLTLRSGGKVNPDGRVGWGVCPGGMVGVPPGPGVLLGCPLGGPPLVGYGVDPRSKTLPPFDFFPDDDLVESFKFDFAFDALDFFDDTLMPSWKPPCCFDFFCDLCRRWGSSRMDKSSFSI